MLAPVRQITDDTSSRIQTVCICVHEGVLWLVSWAAEETFDLKDHTLRIRAVTMATARWGRKMSSHVQCVCVCVWKHSQRGRSLTPTSSTCKNQIVMKRTAVTSFPRVPLCPGILSVAVHLLQRVRHGVCGLTAAWCRMKSYGFTFILQTNKHEQFLMFLMFLMFRVYFLSEAERGGWWEDHVNQTVDLYTTRCSSYQRISH